MINCIKTLLTVLLLICSFKGSTQNLMAINRMQTFDDNWKFALGDNTNARDNEFNDAGWRNLNLPHDWSIEGKIDSLNPTGNDGGYFAAGTGWYRKKFMAPAAWKGKHISIYFEGVYMNAEVFINGRSLGIHPYGYSSFWYDLTEHLDFGKENIISVRVDNSQQKNCRWYSGSGIYRHVKLLVTNAVHIDHWGVKITTPVISRDKSTVQVQTQIRNETGEPQTITVVTTITDKKSFDSRAKNKLTIELPANAVKEVTQQITMSGATLWAPETPVMYYANIQLIKAGALIDNTVQSLGIRSTTFDVENGLRLNGNKIILNGGCVHHDNGCLGAAAYDRAEARRAELLKKAGFNAVRTSHNPPSEAFLNACDRVGLLVIDESFDGWREKKTANDYAKHFDEWWQRDLGSMVLRDRNHPSVIMWSIGNEIIERKSPDAVKTANMLAGYVRQLDATRPVTSAMTTWDKEWEIFDPLFAAHDIGGYNYQLHRAPADHQRVPSRIIVQTESYPKDAFANWKLIHDNSYIIGDFVWTAMDYLGESAIGRYYYPGEPDGEHWEKNFYPWHGAYCGDIDVTGWRKPISHYRDLLYNNSTKLYMAVKEPNPANGAIKLTSWAVWPTWESWTWPGREGKDMEVEVYSKYAAVRLYLNDKLIGERATGIEQQYKAVFTVPYAPGVLKAVGVDNNMEVQTAQLKTAGKAAQIKLSTDLATIDANGQGLAFVSVEIRDENGNIQPNADNELLFSIEGPGVIAGVDNANLKDTDAYISNKRRAWKGRALVVIKSTHKPGKIKLKVSAPGLAGATVMVNAIK